VTSINEKAMLDLCSTAGMKKTQHPFTDNESVKNGLKLKESDPIQHTLHFDECLKY
jgi:hypothetical protein